MKKVEKLSKFLDPEYLEVRVKELKCIQRGDVKYKILRSNNPISKSVYINIYCIGQDSEWYKSYTLRISDHRLDNFNYAQFIINPNADLTRSYKQKFTSMLEKTIERARLRGVYKKMNRFSDDEVETTINLN